MADLILLFVACYCGNLSSKLIKTDSMTARPHIYNGTLTVQAKRGRRFPKCRLVNTADRQQATGPVVHDWPRGLGGAGKRMRWQIEPSFKKAWERKWVPKLRTAVPQDRYIGVLWVHTCIPMFLRYYFGNYVRKSLIKHNTQIYKLNPIAD